MSPKPDGELRLTESLRHSALEHDLRDNAAPVAQLLDRFARQGPDGFQQPSGETPRGPCVDAVDHPFVDLVQDIKRFGDARQPVAAGIRHIVARRLIGSLREPFASPSGTHPQPSAGHHDLPHNWGTSHSPAERPVDPTGVVQVLSGSPAVGARRHRTELEDQPRRRFQVRRTARSQHGGPVLDNFASPECTTALATALSSNTSPTLTDCLVTAHVAASVDDEVVLFVHDDILDSDLLHLVTDLFAFPACRGIVFESAISLAKFRAAFNLPDDRYPARFADLVVATHLPTNGFRREHDWAQHATNTVQRWLPATDSSDPQRPAPVPSMEVSEERPDPVRGPDPGTGASTPDPSDLDIAWGTGARRGWAYEINARRIANRITSARHDFLPGSDFVPRASYDVKVSFDLYRHSRPEWRAIEAAAAVVRIGGPYPPKVLADRGIDHLVDAYLDVDAVIALNDELADHASRLHGNIIVIPNGLDLDEWNPDRIKRRRLAASPTAFTVGLAAALEDFDLRMMKGYHLAKDACSLARVSLRTIGVGHGQVRNQDMVASFYRHIDCLIHPASYGKEGSSNVIMEALALGIPVITTRFAGFHGERLIDRESAMIAHLNAESLAGSIAELAHDRDLRHAITRNGREFAVAHHDLDTVAARYSEVILSVLSAH